MNAKRKVQRNPRRLMRIDGKHPLIALIARAGVTQRELAQACGVKQQSVADWVKYATRNPSYLVPAGRVRAIAETLNTHPAALRPDLFAGLS